MPFPKAYGVVSFDASSPTLVSSYNVASVTDNGRTDSRRVNFTANMSGTNYVVILTPTYASYDNSIDPFYVYSRAADHFIVSREMSFVVFGALAT